MTNPASAISPFDLPELRHRISRFVTIKDALTCALVAKAWSDDFLSVIWFTIDFDIHPQFADLSPDVVTKHGCLIRIVRNARITTQVSVLDNVQVNNLKELRIEVAISDTHRAQAYEVVSRNRYSLEYINLFARSSSRRQQPALHIVSESALVVSSPSPDTTTTETTETTTKITLATTTKITLATTETTTEATTTGRSLPLKSLRLTNLIMTHEDLVSILQVCPVLWELRLPRTDVLGAVITSFQHMEVVNFGSTFKSIFKSFSTSPSLLSYFPNLTTLSTFNYNAGDTGPSSARVKRETSLYCPRLSGYYLEDDTGNIIHKILTKVAKVNTVEKIRFLYEHISQELVTAILLHQSCLRVITHFDLYAGFDLEKDELVPVKNQMEESKKLLQLIPRRCPKLEHVDLHLHEMDMDDVEVEEWVCKDLRSIRTRIKDLDTKEKILKTIKLWRKGCWR